MVSHLSQDCWADHPLRSGVLVGRIILAAAQRDRHVLLLWPPQFFSSPSLFLSWPGPCSSVTTTMTADSVWSPYLQPPHLPPATCPCSFQSCAESPNRITAVPYLETSSGFSLSLQHSAFCRGHKRPSVTRPYPFSPASSLYAPSILVPHTPGIPKSLGSPIFPVQLPCLRTLKMARLLPGMPFASLVAWNAFCLQNSTSVAVSFSRQPPGTVLRLSLSHSTASVCLRTGSVLLFLVFRSWMNEATRGTFYISYNLTFIVCFPPTGHWVFYLPGLDPI